MWTLIKREMDDCRVFFAAAVGYAVFVILILISAVYSAGMGMDYVWSASPVLLLTGMMLFCLMGAGQMYLDRTRKISCFLSTLAVTRPNIFAARVITGLLLIVSTIVPIAAAGMVIVRVLCEPIPVYQRMFWELTGTVSVLSVAGYCVGLLTGWARGRILPALGGVVLTFVLAPVVAIKGFGAETLILLSAFIVISLIRSRQVYVSTPL